MSGAIGIDLGSKNSVIAVVKGGGIEVIMNDLSNRATPSVVGFTPKQRSNGEAGYSKISTNFRNTVLYPTRFLGFNPKRLDLQEELKWTTHNIVEQNGKLTHQVYSSGEQCNFTTEEITATLLTHLMEIVEKNKIKPTEVTISVPAYFNDLERISLLNAISISGIPCVKIMNEGTAVTLSYGLFRNDKFTDVPKTVAFVDLGHSKFSVTISQFVKNKGEVLVHWANRNLGCRDFDWMLMNHLAADFEKKNKIDVMKNQRSRMKLAVAVEKLRKTLSALSDSHFNLEYVIEDLDMNNFITRDQFEALSADLLAKIENECKLAMNKAGIASVSSVEILGGGSRIPMVQRAYARAFNVEQVDKTLNLEEAVSRGCAVQAAMLSPLCRVSDFTVKDMVFYPLKFQYSYPGMDIDCTPEDLFDQKNTFPVTKIINTSKKGPFSVNIINEDQILSTKFDINAPAEENEYKLKLHIKMDRNGVLGLEKAERVERIEEPEAAKEQESEKKEESEKKKEEEKKSKSKLRRTPLIINSELRGLTEAELKKAIENEKKMLAKDRLAHETLEKKNELESFIYDTRVHLNSYLAEYSTPDSTNKLLEYMKTVEEWLYDEGSDTLKDQYVTRLTALRSEVKPIQNRYLVYTELPNVLKNLDDAIKYSNDMFSTIDEKYSHITPTDRQAFLNQATESKKLHQDINLSLYGKNKFEDPGVNLEDVAKKAVQLREVTNQIMNRPKPAPKVEEKKEEVKKEEKTEAKEENTEAKEEKPVEKEEGEQKMDLD